MRPDVVAGRFALCDPLARGATGTVWRAWDLRREAYCAAKVMRQRDAADPLRFAREQGVRLTHPHLLTPYSWAAEDEHVVVASPLVAGGSVHTLLGDYGPLSGDLVADLLDQLLAGLEHAHGAGVVHRDVTPANLLLDATGDGRPQLRLADFGLAVRSGEPRLTGLGTVVGTPGYLPPEALAGALPAPAADLFAAGRVAVALLTGIEPDGGADAPPPGDTGSPLREVVAALVAADPADRPDSAAAARRALAPVRPAEPPLTATGEPVTVLVQLPPLPGRLDPHRPTPGHHPRRGPGAGAGSAYRTGAGAARRHPPRPAHRPGRRGAAADRTTGRPGPAATAAADGCCRRGGVARRGRHRRGRAAGRPGHPPRPVGSVRLPDHPAARRAGRRRRPVRLAAGGRHGHRHRRPARHLRPDRRRLPLAGALTQPARPSRPDPADPTQPGCSAGRPPAPPPGQRERPGDQHRPGPGRGQHPRRRPARARGAAAARARG